MTERLYLRWTLTGSFFSDLMTTPVEIGKEIERPNRAYGVSLLRRREVVLHGETLVGEHSKIGPTCWFGEALTLECIQSQTPEKKTLIDNMVNNGWRRVILCRQGHVPMGDEDVVHPDTCDTVTVDEDWNLFITRGEK